MNTSSDWELEHQLRESLGSPPQADFDRWRARHGDVVAYLNPIVTDKLPQETENDRANCERRRRSRGSLVVRSHVCFPSGRLSLQAVEAIERATTITWTTTFYRASLQ